jgi:hypothetical protein
MAVMEWLPPLNALVENVACPLPFKLPLPITVAPSLNVTVPVGVPAPVTVAVNVTDVPKADGLTEEDRVVVLALAFTVWVRVGEVLPIKLTSPP